MVQRLQVLQGCSGARGRAEPKQKQRSYAICCQKHIQKREDTQLARVQSCPSPGIQRDRLCRCWGMHPCPMFILFLMPAASLYQPSSCSLVGTIKQWHGNEHKLTAGVVTTCVATSCATPLSKLNPNSTQHGQLHCVLQQHSCHDQGAA